jgi:ATP-dependent Clp protease ATP-binding subunit ClpC
MQFADQEAKRLNRRCVSDEHILLGLIKEGSGIAGSVFSNLDVRLNVIRLEVVKLVRIGRDTEARGRLPLTAHAKKVIKDATEESLLLGRDRVGPEHILLGLLHDQGWISTRALLSLGLKLEEIREEVLNLINQDHEAKTVTHDGLETVSASECLKDEFVLLKKALDRPKTNDISAIRLATKYINRMKRTFSP